MSFDYDRFELEIQENVRSRRFAAPDCTCHSAVTESGGAYVFCCERCYSLGLDGLMMSRDEREDELQLEMDSVIEPPTPPKRRA